MQEASRLLTNFLVNSLWQIALIAAAACVAARLARAVSASYQHWIWVAALVVSVAVGFVMLVRTSSALPRLLQADARVVDSASPASSISRPDEAAADRSGKTVPFWAELLRTREHRLAFRAGIAVFLAAVYVAFVLFRMIRFCISWRKAIAIARSASPWEPPSTAASVAEKCSRAMGLGPIPVLVSETIQSPLMLGAARPMILLPTHSGSARDSTRLPSFHHRPARPPWFRPPQVDF
jgi:beta-lactamase regulating signal transducer with metallopeptidase domain